ncbi:olfactory receptor 8H3-like [Rhinophrynus dorsalis]
MAGKNCTTKKEFILVGLSENPETQIVLFILFLCVYLTTVLGNISIILAYKFSMNLHTPMYFFLTNFSFLEICYVSVTVPKLLSLLLTGSKAISLYGCATQMYCFSLLANAECYMLAAMAYDRYNAICQPLLYGKIMNKQVCIQLIAGSWSIGFVSALTPTLLTFSLTFCGDNIIHHFFCDITPLLKLADTNTWINETTIFITAGCVVVFLFISTMISYIVIIARILNIHSTSGKKKLFSTCTSHIIVVNIFYGSGFFTYFRPKSSYSRYHDRLVSVIYSVIAPLLNPFIYSLRNNDVKVAVKKMLHEIVNIRTE